MRNKDEELRREGMAYALRIAKEKGIDSLEEECRFRGATKLPLALPKNAIDECVSKIKLNTIDTVTILSAMVLHDEFDFGKSRIQRFVDRFNKKAECIMDDYATWEDQIQILKELENNAEGKEAYAQEMRQKFPEAEEILKEIKSRYEYEDEEYKIIVPNTLVDIVKEGRALHHCAGSSERYFDRIESRETYICFLRRQEAPGIPFYTIEVEPGGTIRQHRSYYDEEPGIEEIRVFLKEWQKAIRKRLTEEDKKLAKISKIKREANIAELEEKKNTRVLQGLAEDFLEAEEIEKELEAV